jgi:hypothetical protein
MTDEPSGLHFHFETPEEAEARRKDPTWHRTHWFGKGFGWGRGDGAQVMLRDCLHFEDLSSEEKEAVWQKVKAEQDAAREEARAASAKFHRDPPVCIGSFSEAMLPVIKAAFPTNPINDLVGVQPMQRKP